MLNNPGDVITVRITGGLPRDETALEVAYVAGQRIVRAAAEQDHAWLERLIEIATASTPSVVVLGALPD